VRAAREAAVSTQVEPLANSWYLDLETEEEFRVVAVDEDEGIVEIQYRDGELEQIDLDVWNEMDLESADAPDDWEGDDENEDEDDDDWEEEEEDDDEDEDEDDDYDDDDEDDDDDDDSDDDDEDDDDYDEDDDYDDDRD
jgi:hypothetical protein